MALTERRALVYTYTVYSTRQMQGITRAHFSRTQHACTRFIRIYIAKHVSRAYAHVRVIHLYLQVTFSKMRKHASSESFCRIFSSRISSSFPVLHNTINMTLRQQNGIVRWKYTLHAYMHKLCAREIRVTTIHHCTHTRIYLTHFRTHLARKSNAF